jgi:hypothetical protein
MLATAKQKKQLRDLVGTGAAHGVNIALGETDREGLDKALDHSDEIRAAVIQTVTSKIREFSVSNQFANEEVSSKYGYLSGYKKPRSITEQCNTLRQMFPGVGFADEKIAEGQVPSSAEGWFAIPKWQTLAPTYAEAVQKVLDMLKKTRNGKFYNYRDGQIVNERLRQTAKTAAVFQKLASEQDGFDILVVPAQFGFLHRGRSVRRAREVMNSKEFGLGAFAIGIMLLTHLDRLQNVDDLWIDCAGDEFDDPVSVVRFGSAPIFYFGGGKLEFGTCWLYFAYDLYGSASGFASQK